MVRQFYRKVFKVSAQVIGVASGGIKMVVQQIRHIRVYTRINTFITAKRRN